MYRQNPSSARVLADDPSLCLLSNGRVETVALAKVTGKIIVDTDRQAEVRAALEAKAVDQFVKPEARASALADLEELRAEDYQHAIMSLPEARARPRSAARIIAAHNANSMPPKKAAVFLAGLPAEGEPARSAAPVLAPSQPAVPAVTPAAPKPRYVHKEIAMQTNNDRFNLRRRTEIAYAAATFHAGRGSVTAKDRAERLGNALRQQDHGEDLAPALRRAGIDLDTL